MPKIKKLSTSAAIGFHSLCSYSLLLQTAWGELLGWLQTPHSNASATLAPFCPQVKLEIFLLDKHQIQNMFHALKVRQRCSEMEEFQLLVQLNTSPWCVHDTNSIFLSCSCNTSWFLSILNLSMFSQSGSFCYLFTTTERWRETCFGYLCWSQVCSQYWDHQKSVGLYEEVVSGCLWTKRCLIQQQTKKSLFTLWELL